MLGSLKHSVVGISEANGCLGLLEQWIFRIAKAVGYWDGQRNIFLGLPKQINLGLKKNSGQLKLQK